MQVNIRNDLVWLHNRTAFQTTDTNHETQMQVSR